MKLKEIIKELNITNIPPQFRRGVIWLKRGRLLLNQKGNLVIIGKGVKNEYNIKTFFLKPRLSPCEEQEIIQEVSDYTLFGKLSRKTLTAQDITHCNNAEIRRFLLMRYGYDNFIRDIRGKILHKDGDRQLIEINWNKKEEPIKLVKVKDASTDRIYLLRVPPETKTCQEAVAFTFGLQAKQYHPIVEA